MLRRVLQRLQLPDPDPAVVAQGLQQPDDAAVLRPPPKGHVSVQVFHALQASARALQPPTNTQHAGESMCQR